MHKINHSKFWVIAVISNPVRYNSRYNLYKQFEKHMMDSGVNLLTVEIAFGAREHSVSCGHNRHHLQLRTYDELWHKENMINVAIQRLTTRIAPDAEYIAWIDADIEFTRKDWVHETIHQLQHYMWVQMFEDAVDMTPSQGILQTHKSFAWCWHQNGFRVSGANLVSGPYGYGSKSASHYMHPGYAHAVRREALDELGSYHGGPLIDYPAICGSADHHMMLSLIGEGKLSVPAGLHPNYLKAIMSWQERALDTVKKDIGYVPGTILHHWHGKKTDRKYWKRWDILKNSHFDPEKDLVKDSQGLLRLVVKDERQRMLRDQLRAYLRQRNEDSVDVV